MSANTAIVIINVAIIMAITLCTVLVAYYTQTSDGLLSLFLAFLVVVRDEDTSDGIKLLFL